MLVASLTLRCAFSVLLLVTVEIGSAQVPSSSNAQPSQALTPEASLTLRYISDLQLSSDGARLAFVVSEPSKGENVARHIWTYDTLSNLVRQFTYSSKTETSPRWSPDGKQLAFLSNRGEEKQIYVMPANGGEASAVTNGKRNVEKFEWSPDSKQIAFLAPDAKTDAEQEKEKNKDDARVVDKEDKHARLWLLTLGTSEARAITPPTWEINELAWRPAGDRMVVSATDHPESDQETHRIFTVEMAGGAMKQLAAPRGPFGEIRISPDGKWMSYLGSRNDGPAPHDLMMLDMEKGVTRNLSGTTVDRQLLEYQWTKTGELVAVFADGFRTKVVLFNAHGEPRDFTKKMPVNPIAVAADDSGSIFVAGQTATQPQELWKIDGQKVGHQISRLNEAWKRFALAAPQFYKFKSFDGTEIEAALLKPVGYQSNLKVPLITLIHGGPTGAWEDAVETWGQLLAARGYAVFYPNIRGSIGYGQRFIEMNRGDWGGADYRDVMAGIDDLIARGIADPEKLAIGGWSYGGYMSEWAITQTTRFKAAVSGAGLANLISEYGTEEGPSYDEWFYGVPYEKSEGFLKSSPLLYLKNVKTPTLILQGEADTVDPLGQSQELYRGLKRYGVPTQLVVYPREPHGFHEEKHLLDRLHRILEWYDSYLK